MQELEEYVRTLTEKGQVTVPAAIRRQLGLKPQAKVIFRIVDDRVEIAPAPMSLEDTFGSVEPINRPEDFSQLDTIAKDEHAENTIAEMKDE